MKVEPSPAPPETPPARTIRDRAREAVERAWQTAIDAGALPGVPSEHVPPAVEIARPAKAEHGDFATNLAMKLARPLPDGAAGDRRRRSPRRSKRRLRDVPARPIAAADVAPRPASSTSGCRDAALEATVAAILAVARDLGPGRRRSGRGASTSSSCRPTRPARCTSATPAARSSATCSAASSRPAASRSRASTTSTTPARQIGNLGRVGRRRSGAASRSPRTATTATTSHDLAAAVPDDVWAAATRRRRRRRRPSSGSWAAGRVREGIEASLERARRPLRRLDERGARSTTRAGSSGRSSACASGGHVYEQDGALWFRSTDVRRRQGPGHHPLERRADLLRGRHRLRHREVQPRLRPPHLHLGRRPPRDGRPRRATPPRRWATTATRVQVLLYSLGPLRPRRRRRSR